MVQPMTRSAPVLASLALLALAACGDPAPDATAAASPADAAAAEAAARTESERLARDQQKAAFEAAFATGDDALIDSLAADGNAWALHHRALGLLASDEPALQRAAFVDMEAAAEKGHPDAQLWVGTRMASGLDGYPLKPNSGLKMVERAALQGHVAAMLKLGELYEGDQFMADPAKALEWYGKAAAAGSAPAQAALDRINDTGPEPQP